MDKFVSELFLRFNDVEGDLDNIVFEAGSL
jgi:hypothetical protein